VCCSRAALALAAAAIFCCAKPEIIHRVAVLPFENLSAVGAAQDWVGLAVSEEVAGQLEGTRHSAVVSSAAIHRFDDYFGGGSARQGAVALGASRIVTGYYSVRDGRLSITAVMETLPGGAEEQLFSGNGPVDDLLHLCEQIARKIDEEAQPPITGSARALRAYALGHYAEAIQLDPDFGPPYVALAQAAIHKHDPAEFSSVFDAARARSGIAPVYRAILNLDDAEMRASPTVRVDALAALVRITPADPFHLRELADAELEINRFAEAADHYRRLASMLPADSEPANRLGYALMYSGDEPGANKAFQDFRRLDHSSANSLDSTGDGEFFFNHFAEAERDYMAAYQRDPQFTEGTALIKAAWTRLMRKDVGGATQLVDRYLNDRRKQNDPLASFRAALIEELAGRPARAKELLAPYLNSPVSDIRDAAVKQMAVFDRDPAPLMPPLETAIKALLDKDYAQAVPKWRKLAEEASPNDWWTRTIYARVLAETGQTMESSRYARFTPVPQPLRGVGYDEFWFPWILSARKP
jgi:tetratricopeptide (TPR) repeat protein